MDDDMHRNMVMAGVFIALMIAMALWQVLRSVSRGGLDGPGAIRLFCSLVILGVVLYVGYTALSLWT
jgi:hypothetical protein